ncbi:MAG: methylenetetrahydrofolate reductase [Desulfobacterales bacterium]|nr:methylenetetrahydrofolate reductase [Desulfobacterales bacterium]
MAKLPPNDNKAVVNFGIDFAFRQCKELIERGVPGIHIYTMDRSNSSVEIVNRLRNERVI